MLKTRILAGAIALAIGPMTLQTASASLDGDLHAVIARVLDAARNDTEALRNLSPADFRKFVACTQKIMDGAFTPDKRYIIEGRNVSEERQRFNEVASRPSIDRGPTMKQKIGSECYPG